MPKRRVTFARVLSLPNAVAALNRRVRTLNRYSFAYTPKEPAENE